MHAAPPPGVSITCVPGRLRFEYCNILKRLFRFTFTLGTNLRDMIGAWKVGVVAGLNYQLLGLQQLPLDDVVHINEPIIVREVALEKVIYLALISASLAFSFS